MQGSVQEGAAVGSGMKVRSHPPAELWYGILGQPAARDGLLH